MHTDTEKHDAFLAILKKEGWTIEGVSHTSEGALAESCFYGGYDFAAPTPPASPLLGGGAKPALSNEVLAGLEAAVKHGPQLPLELAYDSDEDGVSAYLLPIGGTERHAEGDYCELAIFNDMNAAELVAKACNALPALLAENARLRAASQPLQPLEVPTKLAWIPGIPKLADEDSRAFVVLYDNGRRGQLWWLQNVTLDCHGDKTYENTGWHTRREKNGYKAWFEKYKGSEPQAYQVKLSDESVASPSTIGGPAVTEERILELVNEHFGHAYWANRDWAAWQVGTMTEDDFSPVSESNVPAEFAAYLAKELAAPSTIGGSGGAVMEATVVLEKHGDAKGEAYLQWQDLAACVPPNVDAALAGFVKPENAGARVRLSIELLPAPTASQKGATDEA